MIKNREDLFRRLLEELQNEDFIAEGNFYDENSLCNDFVELCNKIFQDYHILNSMNELK